MELKNILHLYMGCECYDTFNDVNIVLTPKNYAGYMEHVDSDGDLQIKPLLRPLSDMTEEEMNEFSGQQFTAEYAREFIDIISKSEHELYRFIALYPGSKGIVYLLSRGFDLFGLLDSKQAITKSK